MQKNRIKDYTSWKSHKLSSKSTALSNWLCQYQPKTFSAESTNVGYFATFKVICIYMDLSYYLLKTVYWIVFWLVEPSHHWRRCSWKVIAVSGSRFAQSNLLNSFWNVMKSFYIFYFYLLNRGDAQKRSRVERSYGYKNFHLFTKFKRILVNQELKWLK